jgi:hypothetical protein
VRREHALVPWQSDQRVGDLVEPPRGRPSGDAIVLAWSAVHNRRVTTVVAEDRRAELASDLLEQRSDAGDTPPTRTALAILRRMLAGVPPTSSGGNTRCALPPADASMGG